MKKVIIILILTVIFYTPIIAQGTWNQVADLGYSQSDVASVQPRINAVCVGLGDKAYFGTGRTNAITCKKDWWKYDAVTKTWSQKQNLPGERVGAVAISIAGKIYVGGGVTQNGTYLSDFNEYNPVNNVWTSKTAIPGEKRNSGIAFSVDDKGYVGLGVNSSGVLQSDLWQYDPSSGTWLSKSSFPGGARTGAVAFSIGSNGYVGTGATSNTYKNDFWEYNPAGNSWTQKSNFPGVARTLATGFSLNGYGYLGTGSLVTSPLKGKDVWQYNPTTDTWIQKADAGLLGRYGSVSMVVNGSAFIGTGHNSIDRYDQGFWEYDEGNDLWNLAFSIGSQKRYMASAFAVNGKGYICNGFETTITSMNDLWEFDPLSNSWSQKANFPGGYTHSTFGFAINDKGYVGGGVIPNIGFWEYNPSNNSWTQKTTFAASNRPYAISFVIDHKGYVGLGGGYGSELKDLYEYDPVADSWMKKTDFPGEPHSRAVAFVVNGMAYVGTGAKSLNADFHDFYSYDPSSDSWMQVADFPGGDRTEMTGFGIGNLGYIGLGASDSDSHNDFWSYDPILDAWQPETPFPGDERRSASCFVIDNIAYVGIGSNLGTKQFSDFYSFTPAAPNQSITILPLNLTSFCAGYSFEISYEINGVFNAGNVFTAELSDTDGNFDNPVPIGSAQATLSGVINTLIPEETLTGDHYRIRITSSSPVMTSEDNGNDLLVSALRTFFADGDGDSYGDPADMIVDCIQPLDYSENNLDCNDNDSLINPAAEDICNSVDDNCNTLTDENSIIAFITPVGNITACKNELVTLTANTATGLSYQWFRNNLAINGETNSTHSTTLKGNFFVSESNQFNCAASSGITSIDRIALPEAHIIPMGSTDICTTGSVLLQANIGTGLTYQWMKGNALISAATQQTYTAVSKGKYKVQVINMDGCTKTSASTKITSSCKYFEQDGSKTTFTSLHVYPNPAHSSFSIEIHGNFEAGKEITVLLYNVLGHTLYSKKISFNTGITVFHIDRLLQWADGIYMLQVVTDSESKVVRVVLE